MNGMSALWSFSVHICVTYCMCYFVCVFRSLSFLVKLEQLDLGSNELEVLVRQQFDIIHCTVECSHNRLSGPLK